MYLGTVPGNSCTLPFERIRELTGAPLPAAAMTAAWWTDGAGWERSPVSTACVSAGWRLQSVHAAARLVRFRRIERGGAARGAVAARRRLVRRPALRSGGLPTTQRSRAS
jgi:hypothetical protein